MPSKDERFWMPVPGAEWGSISGYVERQSLAAAMHTIRYCLSGGNEKTRRMTVEQVIDKLRELFDDDLIAEVMK